MKQIFLVAALLASLTACSKNPPCPGLSENPDGSYTIKAPTGKSAQDRSLLEGCEYEFDQDGNLGTERDTDG